jgi:NADH-quinone oxidoreductase subunit J
MMLNLNQLEEEKRNLWSKALGVAAGGILMFVLLAAVQRTDELNSITAGTYNADMGSTQNLGNVLYREFLLPFELASVLFLGAMVGAVYLSKKDLA